MVARGSERIVDALEELILELPARVRGSRAKLSEQALGALHALVDDLNLVSRDELDELELRVAQLEHRLRLLEQGATRPSLAVAPSARRRSAAE
jgi:polyhydroxyalkanoate synthesis regulator phasin